jgi:hypothetical protein
MLFRPLTFSMALSFDILVFHLTKHSSTCLVWLLLAPELPHAVSGGSQFLLLVQCYCCKVAHIRWLVPSWFITGDW